jgi:16S rRNA G1207 methylase RsmC
MIFVVERNRAVFGRNHPELLKSINLDLSLPDTSAKMAVDMAKLNAAANGIENSEEEAKIMREKSYVYLKETVDEVRD